MRNVNDLKNAFGEADSGFIDNVYRTLADIQKREEKNTVKKASFKLIIIVTVLGILVTGTALAMSNAWGIIDFLSGRRADVEVLPDADKVVQTDLLQNGGELEIAHFLAREAFYDGKYIYIVIEVTPTKPEYLLLGLDAMLSDHIRNMGPLFDGQSDTIGEYAAANKKTPIHTSVTLNGISYSIDFLLESDGKLIYMLNAAFSSDKAQLPLVLTCVAAPFVGEKINRDAILSDSLTVTLQNNETSESVVSLHSVEYADCGVRVDKVTLTKSPMAIYAEIEFTVIDQEKYSETDGGLWFEFIDENGNILPVGAVSGSIEPTDETGTRLLQKESLRASETLPDEVILRGYNAWEKNKYETHTFEMK